MSSISVNWQNANSIVNSYTSRRRELSSAIASLRSIKSYQCMRGSGFDTIYKAIDRMIEDLEQEKTSLNNLGNGLSEIFSTYRTYESNLSGQISSPKLTQTVYQTSTGKMVEEDENSGWSYFWGALSTIASNAGILGNIYSIGKTIYQAVDAGELSVNDAGSILKNLLSVVSSTGSTISEGADAEWLKALTGFDVPDDDFVTALTKKFVLGDNATWTDKLSLGTKYLGYILEFASEGLENAEEFGIDSWDDLFTSDNTGRMIAETVTESGVDIAIGAVLGAGFTAIAATVGAPAIAAGAAAVGVAWAANAVVKHFTGKDIGEHVSDWLFDEGGVVDKAGDILSGAADVVSGAVSEAASAISDAVGSAANAVSDGLSSISSWWSSTVFA